MFQANNKSLPVESTNKTGTNLQDVIEDCLRAIFSVQSLTLLDLCSLAETCSRFQQITKLVFPKNFRINATNNGDYAVIWKNAQFRGNDPNDIDRILKNFGSSLSACSLSAISCCHPCSCCVIEDNILNLLTKHPVDSLESLKIDGFKVPHVIQAKLKSIFEKLQVLDLKDVCIDCDNELFAECSSLIKLRVVGVKNDSFILDSAFPKLERFGYGNPKVDYSGNGASQTYEKPLSEFILRHKKLKTIHLDTHIDKRFSISILKKIGKSCKDLETLRIKVLCSEPNHFAYLRYLHKLKELEITFERPNRFMSLKPLRGLRSLQTLILWDGSCIDLNVVEGLQELHLHDCHIGGPDNFDSLTRLRKLCIYQTFISHVYDSLDVIGMVERLTNLEELTISVKRTSVFELNEKLFSKIVSIVKDRPHALTLKCKFNSFHNSIRFQENQNLKLVQLGD